MPKYRQVHTKILDSYDFNDMPGDSCRLFWVLLPCVLDREGRGIDNPAWLRSKLYPLRNDVELADIAGWMDWLSTNGLITRYQVGGRSYFYATKWKQYQSGTEKETPSTIPAPPELLQSYSGVTPELVESNSSATPEQLRVNTIQCNNNTMQHNTTYGGGGEIFRVYQSEIGLLTPLISDDLKDLEKEYPEDWITDAFRTAALANARNLGYVKAVLANRKTGKGRPPARSNRRTVGADAEVQRIIESGV